MTEVWSCGGGVQSAAIAALIILGKLPKPDIAAIVDTEREKSSTWLYYDNILKPKLKAVGVDLIRIPKSQFATVDMVSGQGKILLPGYTIIDGKWVKQPGFCSNEWKKRVLQRYCRSVGVKSARNWLGISIDEMKRVRQSDQLWWQNYYPLIYTVPMSRSQCIELVLNMGWPKPPRSSCWMCPNMGPEEILELPMREIDLAYEVQTELRRIDPNFSLEPPDKEAKTLSACMEGMCFV